MKLTEVQQPSDKALFEQIDSDNDTGFLTEDLVKIARAKTGEWKEHLTEETFEAHIRKVCGG